jgi:hypothetical protein
MGNGGLYAEIDTLRGHRAGVAASRALPRRKAGHIGGTLRDRGHVGLGHADVLGGDIAAAQRFDRVTEGVEDFGAFPPVAAAQDHAFAAADRQARKRVLVAHAPGKPQRVGDRIRVTGIMPETSAPGGGAKMGGMDGDDSAQTRCAVMEQMDAFMCVEVWQGPRRGHWW